MKRKFMRWFRRVILRSGYPDSSRSVLELRLQQSVRYILELRHDLRLAKLHGLWREHHPLSAAEIKYSRFNTPVVDCAPASTKALSDGILRPMNSTPLITKKIRLIESHLRKANDVLASTPQTHPDYAEILRTRDAIDDALELAMSRVPGSIDFDAPPTEVATEMLCDLRARLTARQRKTFLAARETRYVARFPESTPGTTKLASRFESAKLSQLGKWLRRALHLSARLRKAAQRAEALVNETMRNNALSAINLRLVNVEITKTLLKAEITRRIATA